jgi:hypothetical protein
VGPEFDRLASVQWGADHAASVFVARAADEQRVSLETLLGPVSELGKGSVLTVRLPSRNLNF